MPRPKKVVKDYDGVPNVWCGCREYDEDSGLLHEHIEKVLVIHDTVCLVEICVKANKFKKTKPVEVK